MLVHADDKARSFSLHIKNTLFAGSFQELMLLRVDESAKPKTHAMRKRCFQKSHASMRCESVVFKKAMQACDAKALFSKKAMQACNAKERFLKKAMQTRDAKALFSKKPCKHAMRMRCFQK